MRVPLEWRGTIAGRGWSSDCLCRDFAPGGLSLVTHDRLPKVGTRVTVRLHVPRRDLRLRGQVTRVRGRTRSELGVRLARWSLSTFLSTRRLVEHTQYTSEGPLGGGD